MYSFSFGTLALLLRNHRNKYIYMQSLENFRLDSCNMLIPFEWYRET